MFQQHQTPPQPQSQHAAVGCRQTHPDRSCSSTGDASPAEGCRRPAETMRHLAARRGGTGAVRCSTRTPPARRASTSPSAVVFFSHGRTVSACQWFLSWVAGTAGAHSQDTQPHTPPRGGSPLAGRCGAARPGCRHPASPGSACARGCYAHAHKLYAPRRVAAATAHAALPLHPA